MNCQYYDSDFETCKNGDCPYCADFCPVTENQEICRYSDLDETEIAHRECLDNEEKDSREALHALAEENQELKKQLNESHKITEENYQFRELTKMVSIDRLRGLAQADRDGRCMVLRFKPDTPVYRLWRESKARKAHITYHYLKSIYDCFEAESWLNAYDSIEAAMADLKKL